MKLILKILLVAFILLLTAVLSSPWWFNFNHLRGPVATLVSQNTGRDASIESIDLDMGWVPRLTVAGIVLDNAEWAAEPEMVNISKFEVSIRLRELFKFNIAVPELTVTAPKIHLERNAEGVANWEFDGPEAPQDEAPAAREDAPLLEKVLITDGEFTYSDATRDFNYLVQLDEFNGSAGGDKPLRADANGRLQGEAFNLAVTAGSMPALRAEDTPYPLDVDLTIGDTHAALKGSIDRPMALRGLDLNLLLEGPNLEKLYPVLGVPLPATPPYKLSGLLKHRGTVWGFEGFDGVVGDSDLAGDFGIDLGGERLMVNADLRSQNLDFDDLAPVIGAPPDAEESASQDQQEQSAEAAAGDSVIPDTEFKLDKLRSADAKLKLIAERINAPGLPIDDMNLDLELVDGLLRLSPLQFGVADGRMNAYATIDASVPTITWDYDVRMRGFRLNKLLESAQLEDAGSGEFSGDIKLEARGNTLKDAVAESNGRVTLVLEGGQFSNLLLELAGADIAEALGYLVTEDKKVPIRCVVADLDIDQGVLDSRTLVVDTADTRIDGELNADLKDETFELKVTPEPKDPSIFSARTPVTVSGSFKDVGVAPDYASLGLRAGAATALGLLATPAAAALAFIEPGLGEDAECDGLLESTEAPALADPVE